MKTIKTIKIVQREKESSFISRVTDNSAIKLSLIKAINGEYVEICRNTTCKDYIGDAIFHNLLGNLRNFSTLGIFKEYSFDTLIFKMRVMSKEDRDLVISKFKMINSLERKVGIPLSLIHKVEDDNCEVVVETTSPFWMKSPLTSSILIQLVRFGVYHTPKTNRKIENYIKQVANTVTNRDGRIARAILSADINFVHLLSDIDRVLGVNNITGIDDLSYIKYLKSGTISRISKEFKIYKDVHSEKNILLRNDNHGYSGIESFSYRLKCLIDSGSNWKYSLNITNGVDWSFNYFKIIKGYDKLDV